MNESAVGRYAGGVSSMFISRVLGRPFTITEWDYVNPNCYNVEGAFLTGAYAALQDWSGLCRFNYAQDVRQINRPEWPLTWFFPSVNDPLRMLSERAGFLFFVRRDVRRSEIVYPFLIPAESMKDPSRPDDFPALPNRLGLIGRTGTMTVPVGKTPVFPDGTRALLGMEKAMDVPLPYIPCGVPQEDLKRMADAKLIPAGCYDPSADVYTSSTGELRLERQANRFRVSTPYSEGFVLKKNQSLNGTFASVANRLCFGAFLVASIDSRPLAESGRILILHLTDSKNSGSVYRTGYEYLHGSRRASAARAARGSRTDAETDFPRIPLLCAGSGRIALRGGRDERKGWLHRSVSEDREQRKSHCRL